MTRPHAVVTGGAGFVGSHLVDALLSDGYRVTSLDNFGSGRPQNLEHIDDSSFESVRHDVCHSFPDFDTVNQIYHFASRASPEDFNSHAVEIALTNAVGAKNAFECARNHDAQVILASTSEVYGDPEEHPQRETYNGNVNIRGPRAPYDESKRFGETLAVAYGKQYDVDIRTVRIFNTYGPRMRPDDGRVIPNFLSQALAGDDLTVYGDGSQTRSFCYVSDLVKGIRAVAEADPETLAGDVVNLGSTDERTIQELAEVVLNVVDTKSTIVYEGLPKDDPEMRQPDISKVQERVGWEPTIELREGIERTVAYFYDQDY